MKKYLCALLVIVLCGAHISVQAAAEEDVEWYIYNIKVRVMEATTARLKDTPKYTTRLEEGEVYNCVGEQGDNSIVIVDNELCLVDTKKLMNNDAYENILARYEEAEQLLQVNDIEGAYQILEEIQSVYPKAEWLIKSNIALVEYLKTPTPTAKPTQKPTPEPTPNPAFQKVGNIVTYGHYEQDNNLANGKEAIEWIVIKYDAASGKSLLLSRYGLDAHRFDADTYQGWDKSEIRKWLNSTFLNDAFTTAEQQGIATTTVKTGNNAEWVALCREKNWYSSSLSGGADTQDKVFLLSLEEAMEYGGYSTLLDDSDKMKATPTKYAVAQGAWQSDSYTLDGTGYCWWWLRSPGIYSARASCVFGGSLGNDFVYSADGSVRPAFWLNL